ncbi:MAG TPA: hypothetical protein VK892_08855 [Pyrinomonadaceae bacterium]|nr:hypothetical protein [Pyrinomonadaceae bacterium]
MKTQFYKIFQLEKFNLFIIFLLASAVMLPVLFNGVPQGYDIPHHYQCALTYRDSILSGDFYPSWTTLRNLGYGSMELRLYPPVSHYVLALFSLAVNDWHLATWLTFTFWWVLGSFGVYLWAREVVPVRYAVFAALAYAVMPYRLNQAYLVFFYGELAGAAILPFCFAFLSRLIREQKAISASNYKPIKSNPFTINVIGFAVSYALLILTHLPLTLIVSTALGVYFLANLQLNKKYLFGSIFHFATGVFLGLAASSFFWLKVLQERFLMAKTSVYEDIYLHYQFNFLLTPFQQYNEATVVVYEVFTLVYDVILLLTLFMLIPVALLAVISRGASKNQLWKSLWITSIFAFFLTTPMSKFIWDNFTILQEVQFPWRWLTIISLFTPMIFATGCPTLAKWFANNKLRPLALILLGTFFIGASFSLSQSIRGAVYYSPNEVNEYVSKVNQTKGFIFWWTTWTRKEFLDQSPEKVSANGREVSIDKWENTIRNFSVEEGEEGNIRIATFYHPNWKATVNNQPVEIRPDQHGAMLILVESQRANIQLEFIETFTVKIAQYFSGFIWSLLLFSFVVLLYKNYRGSTIKFNCQENYEFNH